MFSGCSLLISAPNLPATTLAQSCYLYMFARCTSLTTAPKLPATTLAQSCYQFMFVECTSLTNAPELPATTLAQYCYYAMFQSCTSLTTVPEILPATTLANYCYQGMFYGCISLTSAPELPATTLAQNCYRGMFDGCTSLNYIKCLATDISATNCTYTWVQNVAATGTFIKADFATSWTTGTDGIPSGWNVYTESEWKEVKHYELDTAISNITHPVTSVNGMTGAVVTSLSSNYAAATGVNSALELAVGDTYETTFGKLEKAITDNESVTSTAIDDLDDRLTELTNGVGDKNIIESISLNSITQTIYNKNVNIVETKLSKGTTTGAGNAVTDISVSNHQITLVKGATYATQSDINTSIANLVNSAPETLNTLNELAAALGDDPNFATTVATQIGQKYTKPSLGIPASDLAENAIPVISVNGQTGAVTINTGVTSFNGATGAVTYTAPVTSVNGQTGTVTIQGNIKPDWDATAGSDAEILNKPDLSNFLTIETQSNWNETNISSAAYIQNKPTVVNSVNGMTGAVTINIPDVPVTSVNGMTGSVSINIPDVPVTSVNGMTGAVSINIPDVPVTSVNGMTGAVTINHPVTSVNGMTGAVTITIPTTSTGVTANDNNPVSGGAVYNKFADLIGAAPAALDTLAEIANALNNDADLAGTLTTQISSKVPKVSNPTADNFASFNSDGTIKDSGHSHSDYVTSVNGATGAVSLTIPTVNNTTVTITMNGDTVGTFTLNKDTNTTIDLGTVLTQHQSIKTVNNESLVGAGNIVVSGLPLVSAADNGKILMVVNGQWQLVSPSTLYSGSGVPNNANGNNGDLYMQTD